MTMTEQVAYEHRSDLQREAAAYRTAHPASRIASRKAKTAPRLVSRVTFHRRPAAIGCEA